MATSMMSGLIELTPRYAERLRTRRRAALAITALAGACGGIFSILHLVF